MRMTRAISSVTVAGMVLALAGCAGDDPAVGETATNEPTTGGKTTSAQAEDPFAVPKPLNIGAISDVCNLLTSQQVSKLGAGSSKPGGESLWGGPKCEWADDQFSISISPDTVPNVSIRSGAKRNTEDGKPDHYIRGYPAVYSGSSDISCATFVGVSRADGFIVHFTVGYEGRNDPKYSDPCAWADKIAGMVLKNLPPA